MVAQIRSIQAVSFAKTSALTKAQAAASVKGNEKTINAAKESTKKVANKTLDTATKVNISNTAKKLVNVNVSELGNGPKTTEIGNEMLEVNIATTSELGNGPKTTEIGNEMLEVNIATTSELGNGPKTTEIGNENQEDCSLKYIDEAEMTVTSKPEEHNTLDINKDDIKTAVNSLKAAPDVMKKLSRFAARKAY